MKAVLLVALAAAVLAGTAAGGTPKKPWLWQCEQIHLEQAKDACYVRLLLLDINRSGDPATELPRIDARAKAQPTSLYARCHMLMHVVGRQWAIEHHLTLDGLQTVVPRSNDPGCSAGFGMGLVMALGPPIIATGGKSALKTCEELPTRLRQFTCVHSLGHALMRGYHETIFLAVHACTKLGAAATRPTARRAHSTTTGSRCAARTRRRSPLHAIDSPRRLCAQYRAIRARVLVPLLDRAGAGARDPERPRPARALPRARRRAARRLHRRGVEGRLRHAGRAGAALREPPCGADALACLRGVANQAFAGQPRREVALFGECARMPAGAGTDARRGSGRRSTCSRTGASCDGCPRVAFRAACVPAPGVGRAARDLLLAARGLSARRRRRTFASGLAPERAVGAAGLAAARSAPSPGRPRAADHPPRLRRHEPASHPAQAEELVAAELADHSTSADRRRSRGTSRFAAGA